MLPFEIAVIVLALLIYLPTTKLIWVWSVRRLERRLQRVLSEEERAGQLKRARFIGAIISLVFSWGFNKHLMIVMERAAGG
ncbi:MAG: hypothetical protein R3174_09515 [Gammaproteobacteria bacterium]|nr:hypothetical protein [Gammaproteobacteria bacterium]